MPTKLHYQSDIPQKSDIHRRCSGELVFLTIMTCACFQKILEVEGSWNIVQSQNKAGATGFHGLHSHIGVTVISESPLCQVDVQYHLDVRQLHATPTQEGCLLGHGRKFSLLREGMGVSIKMW